MKYGLLPTNLLARRRGRLIEAALDYLILARYAADPGLQKAWRCFARACSHRLTGLPPEAQAWIVTADEFDAGRITAEPNDSHPGGRPVLPSSERFEEATLEERGALSAAKHRLWPQLDSDPESWHSTAWYFLHWCAWQQRSGGADAGRACCGSTSRAVPCNKGNIPSTVDCRHRTR